MREEKWSDEVPHIEMWEDSAAAWIKDQGENGDRSRRTILDPALEKILPDLVGKTVLDVGCGEGRYSRILKERGASVYGIDPVLQFIEHARSRDSDSVYVQTTAEKLPFDDGLFDLAISYLSLIDIPDLEAASREIMRVLKPNGQLLIVNVSNFASCTEGWSRDLLGRKTHRKVDRYMEHFHLDLEWRNIRVRNYHRPLSYILSLFLDHGFVLSKFLEPLPSTSDAYYAQECRAPNFQIYMLQRLTALPFG